MSQFQQSIIIQLHNNYQLIAAAWQIIEAVMLTFSVQQQQYNEFQLLFNMCFVYKSTGRIFGLNIFCTRF